MSIHKQVLGMREAATNSSIAAGENAVWPLLMTAALCCTNQQAAIGTVRRLQKVGGMAKLTMTAGFFTRLPAALRGVKPILEKFGTFSAFLYHPRHTGLN